MESVKILLIILILILSFFAGIIAGRIYGKKKREKAYKKNYSVRQDSDWQSLMNYNPTEPTEFTVYR
jgi:uncharacterized protein YneF (UPF0154 family)